MPHVILLLAALQVSAQQAPATQVAQSPIDRIEVTPENPSVIAQDSLQLTARALDANGRVVEDARIRFVPAGGRFEGFVEENGLVRSGATGTLPVTVVALVPGTQPVTRTLNVPMVPGPPTRIELVRAHDRLVVGQRLVLGANTFSRHGDPRQDDRVTWRSSAAGVVRVSDAGVMTALAPGRATVTASAGAATESFDVEVIANEIGSVEVRPATSAALTGDVIRFTVDVRDRNGQPIRGLVPTWSFSPGSGMIDDEGAFVGYERGQYTIVANLGDRSASAIVELEPRDVRRPAQVVGRLPRTRFTTEEVWLHPNGRNLYLGTGRGGDVLYAIDVSDPANPVVTDSLVANTRRVNDVMTTPDGSILVHTREGAADRRNGIVIASLEDPAHPRVIAEYTQDVTAGVHSAFVYQQAAGTHVYLTNNGTAAMHVIDITDPYNPREVGRWRAPSVFGGGSLHDIDVQDGLAYLSNWNEGLIILDVGNGVKGGSPSNPQFVSQYRYDLNDMYRQVEATGGPGFIRGTHTAWRHRNYVFIADEVFPATGVQGARDAAAGRAYGRLQVVDVSDLENPHVVAWYEPEYGGVHNVWVAGDTLYMGAYNAGFRTFDISGELRGDLRAQQREMTHVNVADMNANSAGMNTALTWGVVVRDGLAYVNDINSGLWIVRMLPKNDPPPLHP